MAILRAAKRAFGAPGIAPRWTQSAKDAIGTAYSAGSTVWFTVSAGILNEVYYPTIDRPQIRDLQYLVTDGETFYHGCEGVTTMPSARPAVRLRLWLRMACDTAGVGVDTRLAAKWPA